MPNTRESWKMFNQISSTYDRLNRILSFGMDHKWRKKVAQNLPIKKKLQVLDLATGTGDQLFSLFENGPPIEKAIGIDMAENMLDIAKQKTETKTYKDRIELLYANAEKLPFSASRFDAATFSFGIRNVPNPLQALREIHRILKPEGKCLILEFSLPPKPIQGPYLLYLRKILPRVGGFFSKTPSAYLYLNQTIETFPSGDAFATLLRKADFQKITMQPMALGAVTLYTGIKT